MATPPKTLSREAVDAWIERSVALLGAAREGLNSENVYPVADGDTGTNVWATMEAGRTAVISHPLVRSASESGIRELGIRELDAGEVARIFAQGALLGARGNSGVIMSQILAGIAAGLEQGLPIAFADAKGRAFAAVSEPRHGTILTAIESVAVVAAKCADDETSSLVDIARAAWNGARRAAIESAIQPPIPEAAGVIDAGAHALERVLAALVEVLDPDGSPVEGISFTPANVAACAEVKDGEYEVMYLLSSRRTDRVAQLRVDLEEIGSSVLVVGEEPTWNIHVHTDEAGGAVDAGMRAGTVHRIRITSLDARIERGRRVITVANGVGLSSVLRSSGVFVIEAFESRRVTSKEWVEASEGAGEVLLLPHDKAGKATADEASMEIRQRGARVAVIPSRSPVQSLAAIALHDESQGFDAVLGQMTQAVAHARYATIAVARRSFMTSVGDCEPGDVLALMNGDVEVIGKDIAEVACATVELMVTAGGDLLTLVIGEGGNLALAEVVSDRARLLNRSIDISVIDGGQSWYPLLLGLE